MAVGLQYLAKQHGLSIAYEDSQPNKTITESQRCTDEEDAGAKLG